MPFCRCVAASLLLIASMAFSQQGLTINGTATYRERMALPPDAVFEATLEDVSRVDATANVLGRTRIETRETRRFIFRLATTPSKLLQTTPT